MFVFGRKVTFRSQEIQDFVFLNISFLNISHIVNISHLNISHKVTKLGQLIDICKGNNFQETFEQFRGLGLSSRSFSI